MTFKLLDLSLSLSLSHTHAHIKDQKWWAQIYYMMIPILLFMMQSTCTNFRLPKADISIAYKTCNPDTAHWWSNLYTDVTDLVFNSKADTVWTDMQIKVKKKKKSICNTCTSSWMCPTDRLLCLMEVLWLSKQYDQLWKLYLRTFKYMCIKMYSLSL